MEVITVSSLLKITIIEGTTNLQEQICFQGNISHIDYVFGQHKKENAFNEPPFNESHLIGLPTMSVCGN